MSKKCGKSAEFALVREERSQLVVGYGKTKVDGKSLYEWYEVGFNTKKSGKPTLDQVKQAIFDDINSRTDEKILSGFVWNNKPVWLSAESQTNFSAAEYTASTKNGLGLPVTFKLGEQDGTPVYHEFTTVEELSGFYLQAQAYIKQCIGEGWQEKDNIDWEPYEEYFNQ